MSDRDFEGSISPDEELRELLRGLPPTDLASVHQAAKRWPCKRCGSSKVAMVTFARSLHYSGKAICHGCGNTIYQFPKAVPTAMAPPLQVLAQAKAFRRAAARLRGGSAELIEQATAVRARMVRAATRRRDLDRAIVLRAIADPEWFVRHERTRYSHITWPTASQLDVPDDSATFVGPQSDRPASSAPDPLDELIEAEFRHEAGSEGP